VKNPFFIGFPKWYERAWLCFDTQTHEEFNRFWRLEIAPHIEKLVKENRVLKRAALKEKEK
jgi:hypothetical protein